MRWMWILPACGLAWGCTQAVDLDVPDGAVRNAVGMWLVPVPAGSFLMGSPPREEERFDDEALHSVTLTGGLWVAATEVTQAQWRSVMDPEDFAFSGKDRPVDGATWTASIRFCNELSKLEGLRVAYRIVDGEVVWDRTAAGYRLPTEAEWEYVARAGAETPFCTGTGLRDVDANFQAAYPYGLAVQAGVFRGETTPVGSFVPNDWGLYDVHGNVWEWCWDRYGAYDREDVIDPAGLETGEARVIRGGSWYHFAAYARLACRGRAAPDLEGNPFMGFRPVRSMD